MPARLATSHTAGTRRAADVTDSRRATPSAGRMRPRYRPAPEEGGRRRDSGDPHQVEAPTPCRRAVLPGGDRRPERGGIGPRLPVRCAGRRSRGRIVRPPSTPTTTARCEFAETTSGPSGRRRRRAEHEGRDHREERGGGRDESREPAAARRRKVEAARGREHREREAARDAHGDQDRQGDGREDREDAREPGGLERRARGDDARDAREDAERDGDLRRGLVRVPAQAGPEEREADEPGDEERRERGRSREEPEEEDRRVAQGQRRRHRLQDRARERDRRGEEERAGRGAQQQRPRPAARGERALEDGPLDAAVEIALLAEPLTRGVERERRRGFFLSRARAVVSLVHTGPTLPHPWEEKIPAIGGCIRSRRRGGIYRRPPAVKGALRAPRSGRRPLTAGDRQIRFSSGGRECGPR